MHNFVVLSQYLVIYNYVHPLREYKDYFVKLGLF